MKKGLFVILALLFITIQVNAELKFVVQLYRHGARSPLGNWYDANQQLATQGELSPTGQRQHYNLGVKLREEYQGFIPRHYNHSEIYVRASDVNRTLMSAASQLQGMFPEHTGNFLPANLSEFYTLPAFKDAQDYLSDTQSSLPNNIQVLPIHTQLTTGDIVLQPDQNCKNYSKIKAAFYAEKKDVVNFVNQQFNNTYQQYSLAINQTVKNFDDMKSLESTFECDRYNGRYVPDFSSELRENATFLTSLSWNFLYDQPELLRAMNTPFLNQLLAYTNPVVQGNNTNGLKWVMFSAHDTNVHLVSAALNFTSIDCLLNQRFPDRFPNVDTYYNCETYPRFTASLIFELHQANSTVIDNGVRINNGEYYIRIRRDGKFMNLCQRNSTICSYSEFNSRVNTYSNDFNAVCNGPQNKPIQTQKLLLGSTEESISESDSSIYYIFALIIQQLIIVVGGAIFYKRSKLNKVNALNNYNDMEAITVTQN